MDQEYIKKLFDYDGNDLVWKIQKANRLKVGDVAGHIIGCECRSKGYRHIKIDGKVYKAHRLVWLWNYGIWPEYELDHIDGNPSNNRLDNLRPATHLENSQNRKTYSTNNSGHPGIGWYKKYNKWRMSIMLKGKMLCKYFDDYEEACQAYRDAKANLHTFQPTIRETA